MVKSSSGTPQPIEPRPPSELPPEECPSIELEVELSADAFVQPGDLATAQARDGRVRVLVNGQVIGWIGNPGISEAIALCEASGGRYEGHVTSVENGHAVIPLESQR